MFSSDLSGLGATLAALWPGEGVGCVLLGAGLGFTFVYVVTLATILTCHLEEL